MSRIIVQLDTPVVNGKQVSFFSPIGSADARSILIHDVEYALVDSHGQALAKLDYSWTAGALVSLILDTSTNKAYVQNATSNAYIEDNFLKKTTKPEDIGAVPSGYGFAERAKDISATDLLDTLKGEKSGFYVGSFVTNAPNSDNDWYYYEVIPQSKNHCTVMAHRLWDRALYQGQLINDTWYGWVKVFTYSDVPNARTNLGFVDGEFTSRNDSNEFRFDTGAKGSNVIMLHGTSSRGFLCPWGGFLVYDIGSGIGQSTQIQAFGYNSGEIARYENGVVTIKSSHDYIKGMLFHYWCL